MFLPLKIESSSGVVSGSIAGLQRGPIRYLRLDSSAHYGVRTPDLASGAGSGCVTLAFATSGRLEVRQHGRRIVLAPGEFTIYDTSDAFSVGGALPFGAEIAMLPLEALNISADHVARMAAREFDTQSARELRAILRECQRARGPVRTSLEYVGGIIRNGRAKHSGRAALFEGDDELIDAVRECVAARLADRRLSPDFIAGVLGVSRRRLYYACDQRLGPLARYIRQERLGFAARLLRNREWRSSSIAEIASLSGFDDQAHFSRVFRRAFGVPPMRARAAAVIA